MAYTPLDFWSGWMRNSAAMMQTGFRLAETAQASSAVISSRSKTILAAGAGSSAADQAELARMVPEKIEAFSRAGMATFSDIVAFQTDAMSAWQQLAGMAMSGRLPTATQLEAFAKRGTRMADRAAAAGGKALAPIHRKATGNARRLSAKKPG